MAALARANSTRCNKRLTMKSCRVRVAAGYAVEVALATGMTVTLTRMQLDRGVRPRFGPPASSVDPASLETLHQSPNLTPVGIVGFHLIPGVVFSALLILLSQVFVQHGLTGYLAELLLIPTCLLPMLLGIMVVSGGRAGPRPSLRNAIAYRARGTAGDYLVWPILLFLCWALASLAVVPLSSHLESWYLAWFPAQLGTHVLVSGVASSPPGQRHVTLVLAILLSGFLAPLVEEAYFRGFLLPRMRHLGWLAPVISAFLFGLYHFFLPWGLPMIFVAFLPIAFVVQAKHNFRIGVVVHAMFNLMGVLTVFSSSA
jgi:membrane protease YdiL (CAAX protease family)